MAGGPAAFGPRRLLWAEPPGAIPPSAALALALWGGVAPWVLVERHCVLADRYPGCVYFAWY